MQIKNPLSAQDGHYNHISTVLRQLAGQEGCDGEPYDQMIEAAYYIDYLEEQLKCWDWDIMTAKQVAVKFQVSETTIRRNYRSLGGVKIGSQYRFSKKGVQNALQEGEEMGGNTHVSKEKVHELQVHHKKRGNGVGELEEKGTRRGWIKKPKSSHGL